MCEARAVSVIKMKRHKQKERKKRGEEGGEKRILSIIFVKSLARGGRTFVKIQEQSVNPRSIGQLDDPAEDSRRVGLSLTLSITFYERAQHHKGRIQFFRGLICSRI